MALEDIKARIAAEQKAQTEAARERQREAEATKAQQQAELDALKKQEATKKDAARLEKERKQLDSVIKRLASGEFEEASRAYQTLLGEATQLDSSIKSLERRLRISQAGKGEMVGELPAERAPFGGKAAVAPSAKKKEVKMETQALETPTPSAPAGVTPTGNKNKKKKKKDEEEVPETRLTREEILARYPIIDALFEQDPELRRLLEKYLDPKSKMTIQQFKDELGQAQYNFRYADVIKQRLAEKAVYDRLGAGATGQTTYERNIAGLVSQLEATAQELGATVTADDLNRIATNIYLAGTEARPLVIERALSPFIKIGVSPVTGRPTIGGAAGANYQSLLQIALANGISESLMPKVLGYKTADEALRNLAEGASIRDLENKFREYAMNGRSDYVKNLLAQGMDLDTIMAPYRNMMADVLEIANPEQIKLDDPTLNMAFGKQEMTLTDFQRALRKDTRWQYTQKARDEMSSTALNLLRNFGFQG